MAIKIAPSILLTPRRPPGSMRRRLMPCLMLVLFVLAVISTRADQVEMRNGDRYVGKVLSLNATTLTLHNGILGTVRLPRSKVTRITLGTATPRATTKAAPARPGRASRARTAGEATNSAANFSGSLRQLGANTNLIRRIQSQFLGGAGPEANAKFNELLNGLISGKVTIGDLRAQAKTAADQLRSLQRSLGKDGGGTLDGYLAILDSFLNETQPSPAGATNAPAAGPKVESAPASNR